MVPLQWCKGSAMKYHWSPRRFVSVNASESFLATKVAQAIRDEAAAMSSELKNDPKFGAQLKNYKLTPQCIMGGMRGLPLLVWQTSSLDAQQGIKYRGLPLTEVMQKLKCDVSTHSYPTAEAVFGLLLTGSVEEAVSEVTLSAMQSAMSSTNVDDDLILRSCRAVDLSEEDTHPMTQFIQGLIGAQNASLLAHNYSTNISSDAIASATLVDGTVLLRFLPILAGYVYRKTTNSGPKKISPLIYLQLVRSIQSQNPNLDWCGSLARYMGIVGNGEDENPEQTRAVEDLIRLFIMAHADHEGGNVSAHISHIVSSAHADIFYSYVAAMCGLAAPLHGLANRQSLEWQKSVFRHLYANRGASKGSRDTDSSFVESSDFRERLATHVENELNDGAKIPGFGHAVLRTTDPRYTLFREFGLRLMNNDKISLRQHQRDLIKLNHILADVVPDVMKKFPKIQSPHPNVDHGSGAVLEALGVNDCRTYTMLFGISRALGIVSSTVWSRSLKLPIERPKSVTVEQLQQAMHHEDETTSS